MSSDAQAGVRQYRLLAESLPRAEQLVRRQQVVPYLLILGGVFLVSTVLGMSTQQDLTAIITSAIIAGLFLTYILFAVPRRTRRALARCWETYLLEIGPDYLLRRQADTPDVRLSFSEVKRIERRPGEYVRVVGMQAKQVIGIPEGIERSDEVWKTVFALAPINEHRTNHFIPRHLAMVVFGAAFLAMLWSASPRIVLPVAVLLIGVLIWAIVELRQNPNVSRTSRRRAIWSYAWVIFLVSLKVFTTVWQMSKKQ